MENTAGPSILKSTSSNIEQSASQISKNPKGFFKRNVVKIIIAVLVIAVVGEVIFGAYSIFSPSSEKSSGGLSTQGANEMRSAQISLIPTKTVFKKGETVEIDVRLFTGGYTTDSTDLVVKYDPQYLSATGENFAVTGDIYSQYPAVQVDEKNGLIGVSGITLPGEKSYSGAGSFAKLNFKALKDGQTQVSVDFQPSSTADSNVVLSGTTQDIVGAVVNADINISDTAAQTSNSNAVSCEKFTQSCQNTDGQSGTQVCMQGAVVDGVCGYDPKLTTSCEACKI